MSYGWLTESSILPKKSKEIVVSDAGTVALQAAILGLKDRQKNTAKPISQPRQAKKNPGVEERNKKDEQARKDKSVVQKNSQKILQKKVNVYQSINERKMNVSKLLVDFEEKGSLSQSKKEEEEYEKDREDFYNGKIKLVEEQQKTIHDHIQTEKTCLTQMRERLAWEREMLSEMKADGDEDLKPKVVQSFDRVLTKEEKEALEQVVDEEKDEKWRLEQIKRRRDLTEFERIRKLRKLNIVKPEDRHEE